jgi:hypothetical protein
MHPVDSLVPECGAVTMANALPFGEPFLNGRWLGEKPVADRLNPVLHWDFPISAAYCAPLASAIRRRPRVSSSPPPERRTAWRLRPAEPRWRPSIPATCATSAPAAANRRKTYRGRDLAAVRSSAPGLEAGEVDASACRVPAQRDA